LLQQNADANATNTQGATPLDFTKKALHLPHPPKKNRSLFASPITFGLILPGWKDEVRWLLRSHKGRKGTGAL
jgi:hypothetical protein